MNRIREGLCSMQCWGFLKTNICVFIRALSAVEPGRLGGIVLCGFVLVLSFRAVLMLDQDMPNSKNKTNFATCKFNMALTL